MLYIGYLMILGAQKMKKSSSEILLPSASPPRRESTPRNNSPKKGKNNINTAENMLYIPWMVILCDYHIKKKSF